MRKIIIVLFIFHLFFISCSKDKNIEMYEVENIGNSNFSIHHSELYENEKLIIRLNDRIVYIKESKVSNYKVWRFYKIPFNVKKMEIKSWQNGVQILDSTIIDTINKPKEVIISIPYRKGKKKIKFPSKLGDIPIEKSERDVKCEYYSPDELQRNWY